MKIGDKVKIKCLSITYAGKEGVVIDRHWDYVSGRTICSVNIKDDGVIDFFENDLELVEPKSELIHLDLTREEWNALADLLKMKTNIELLERLAERVKKDE